jgi:hypothetical protein
VFKPMLEALKRIPAAKVAGGVAFVSTLLIIYLHVVFGLHAGALWRDEVNSLEIATMRTFTEMWSNLAFDSFPALFFILLRAVAGVPATASDAVLRTLGVSVGLLALGVIWLNSRWLRLGFPLLSLTLIGLNPMIIRYGDSIRAYGLGIVLMLLVLGAMWRLVERWTPARAAIATASALLSVQCLYYNSILLFAVCLGAAAVTLRRRAWKETAGILLIGAISATSLLPYLSTIRRVQLWSFIWKGPFTMPLLWQKLSETLGAPILAAVWVWVALFVLAILGGIVALWRGWGGLEGTPNRERVLFALVTLLIGTAGYVGFLKVLSYMTQPWYYVVLAAFAVTCIEMILASIPKAQWLLVTRTVIALVFTGAVFFLTLQAVQARQTNIDAVAARIESLAGPDDLILINTWNFGISFRRYYHGPASYQTIPPMEDIRSHRVDILKRQMMSPAPMTLVLQRMDETLRRGHTIWLLGTLDFVPPGREPLVIPPGFDGPNGWVSGNFYSAWAQQAGFLVQSKSLQFERIRVPMAQSVSHYEDLPLSAIRGWRGAADTARQ